jgi:rhodanese-like protein
VQRPVILEVHDEGSSIAHDLCRLDRAGRVGGEPYREPRDRHGRLSAFRGAGSSQRETHRLSESEFIHLSREPGTVVLDARSREKYDELHVRGAINLSFPDITASSLERTIGRKTTRVLIYCNNNFANAPGPFPEKMPPASLNLSTYIALYTYGYLNVYELGPNVDIAASKLEFESACADRPCEQPPADDERAELTLRRRISTGLRGH